MITWNGFLVEDNARVVQAALCGNEGDLSTARTDGGHGVRYGHAGRSSHFDLHAAFTCPACVDCTQHQGK